MDSTHGFGFFTLILVQMSEIKGPHSIPQQLRQEEDQVEY